MERKEKKRRRTKNKDKKMKAKEIKRLSRVKGKPNVS